MQETFRDVNMRRCVSPNAFDISITELSHFALGLSEEAGEVCGILKRLRRGFTKRDADKFLGKVIKSSDPKHATIKETIENLLSDGAGLEDIIVLLKPYWYQDLQEKLKKELADVFCYWDLLAASTELTASDIKNKFNEVTKECGFSDFFEVTEDTPIIIK